MEFVKFKRAVHAQFNQLAAGADMLFLTNVDKDALWLRNKTQNSKVSLWKNWLKNSKHLIDYGL